MIDNALRYAAALIVDRDPQTVEFGAGRYLDNRRGGRIFDRIVQDIDQDLMDGLTVAQRVPGD